MDHRRPDPLTDPEEDPRVVAALVAVATRLSEPPDEVTAHRHLAAISAASGMAVSSEPARPRGNAGSLRQRLVRRSALASAAAVLALVILASGGWLPGPAQQLVAESADRIGVTLPRAVPTPAVEAPPAGRVTPEQPGVDAADGADPRRDATVGEAGGDSVRDTQDLRVEAPARFRPHLDLDRPAEPSWDIDPRDRVASRPGARPQHPSEPGPPAVDPPSDAASPTPGRPARPGPPADRAEPGSGPGTGGPVERGAARSARDARPADPSPPRPGRPR